MAARGGAGPCAERVAGGWKLNGEFREKDGKQLVIRDVLYDAQSTRQFGQIAQNNLAQIGVKLVLDAKPGNNFFSQYINTGDRKSTRLNSSH